MVTNTHNKWEQIAMSRYEDDRSYDYSDYVEGKGYYEPYREKEPDYDPIEHEEMRERLKEVKTRLGDKYYD